MELDATMFRVFDNALCELSYFSRSKIRKTELFYISYDLTLRKSTMRSYEILECLTFLLCNFPLLDKLEDHQDA